MESYEKARDEAALRTVNEVQWSIPDDFQTIKDLNKINDLLDQVFKEGSDFGKSFSDKQHEAKHAMIVAAQEFNNETVNKAIKQRDIANEKLLAAEKEIAELEKENRDGWQEAETWRLACGGHLLKIEAQESIIAKMEEALKSVYYGTWKDGERVLPKEALSEALTALKEFREKK